MEDISSFCGFTDTNVLVTSALGFKIRVDALDCVFCCFMAAHSNQRKPRFARKQALLGFKSGLYHAVASEREIDALPTELLYCIV